MTTTDYKLYDMPSLLGRTVKKVNPEDESNWIRDDGWYEAVRAKYFALFRFLQDKDLIGRKLVSIEADVDGVVVKASDLTDEGRLFIASGADERWLKSFDRPGSKKKSFDTSYLERELAKQRLRKK